jgi:hypothetical protein
VIEFVASGAVVAAKGAILFVASIGFVLLVGASQPRKCVERGP